MRVRTRITQVARERGWTAREVARQVGLYPSNISATDHGVRSISLRLLSRIARFLCCAPSDLLVTTEPAEGIPFFSKKAVAKRLEERDLNNPDGLERKWVHAALLAWQRHYRSRGLRK